MRKQREVIRDIKYCGIQTHKIKKYYSNTETPKILLNNFVDTCIESFTQIRLKLKWEHFTISNVKHFKHLLHYYN